MQNKLVEAIAAKADQNSSAEEILKAICEAITTSDDVRAAVHSIKSRWSDRDMVPGSSFANELAMKIAALLEGKPYAEG